MAEISAIKTMIPIFLEAGSKQDLMKKMLLTNQLNGKKFNYMQPVLEGKVWVVWFYDDVSNHKSIEALSEDDIKVMQGFVE